MFAFKQFIQCSKDESIGALMDKGDNWKKITSPEYLAPEREFSSRKLYHQGA